MSASEASPDFRSLGQARLDSADRAKTEDEWARVFGGGASFPFTWGRFWKLYVQYQVEDLPAEIGFFMDGIGFESSIFCADQVVLTGPDRDFHFSVIPTPEGSRPTPPESILLSFMIEDLGSTVSRLETRGVRFEEAPRPLAEGDPMSRAACRTPNGVRVELYEFTAPGE